MPNFASGVMSCFVSTSPLDRKAQGQTTKTDPSSSQTVIPGVERPALGIVLGKPFIGRVRGGEDFFEMILVLPIFLTLQVHRLIHLLHREDHRREKQSIAT
jgi:hypothetical protein